MPWYVSVANGFVKSHLFAPGCYGFSSPQRLYEKVSTHPHLNPHGCCLTFPLLHIRVCVKNRAPTKTHCLKPHCGIAGLDKPLYTDGEYAHLSLCWLIPLWLLVVEILCWTKPYRDASSFQLLVTFGGMNIHSSFRCSLLLFFFLSMVRSHMCHGQNMAYMAYKHPTKCAIRILSAPPFPLHMEVS